MDTIWILLLGVLAGIPATLVILAALAAGARRERALQVAHELEDES